MSPGGQYAQFSSLFASPNRHILGGPSCRLMNLFSGISKREYEEQPAGASQPHPPWQLPYLGLESYEKSIHIITE
jgi:hypothetical protein